jgi:TonB family protein
MGMLRQLSVLEYNSHIAMKHKLLSFALLCLLMPGLDGQQQRPARICVRHVVVPTVYPTLARQARVQGTVVAKLKVAADGTVTDAIVESQDPLLVAHPILQHEAQQCVRQWTFECQSCAPGVGFEHVIKFNYRLEGKDSQNADTKITMELPDEVNIVARPPLIQGYDEGFSPSPRG